MVAPTPLHPDAAQPEEPLSSPEVLVLNALLRTERFDPQAYGVDLDMLANYQQAWRFCQNYQDSVGHPPAIELFSRSFPTVEILGGVVDPRWAADKLREAHYGREVRRHLATAARAIRDGDLDTVREAVRELAMPNPLSKPKGMNITDVASVAQSGIKIGFNTPWPSLNAATNGVGRGELWLLAARLGQGKSQMLPGFALYAAQMGAHVKIASCEMPMRQYIKRVHSWQARGDRDLQRALRNNDEQVRTAALSALPELAGSIEVFDPSTMRMNLRGIETLAGECDLLLIDHVGLLQDHAGKRAIEDWRVMAVISNSLKEISLRFNIAILGAAQVNREGENAGSAPPKVSQLSQSDALGQDADVVITLRRIGETSMMFNLAKNRDGHNTRYHTTFEPASANYTEITGDQARVRAMSDADLAANA